MRDTVSTGRSAATGGWRVLLFLALLALLHAALTTGASDAAALETHGCLTRAGASLVPGPAERPCVAAAPVLASNGDGDKRPGSGFRRMCEASVCHLRHPVPTGPGGKAIRESAVTESVGAPSDASSWAVITAAAAPSPTRVTVLRC
ncbi:hypothetical protein ACWD6P_17310 [Streptomyces sp. NPDC002446]